MSRRGTSVYEGRDYYEREREEPRRAPARTREVEEIDIDLRRGSRPSFLRDDHTEIRGAGPLVLRERDIETFERPIARRPRSLSPVRIRERIIERERERERSPSPPPVERIRTRVIERERERRSPSPPPQIRTRVVETRERVRERSPSPVRIRERIIERERERTPSPVERTERVRIRNIERESVRAPTPSPSPSPPPPVIRAPPIHQEIVTHHRHIDHGLVYERAPVPSPPPPPRRSEPRTRETDIDIYTSRNNTEVDITQKSSRSRTPQPRPEPVTRRDSYYDDTFLYEQERNKLRVQETKLDIHRRRSASARPERREREVEIDIRENIRPERRERDRLEIDIREDIRPQRRERDRLEIDIREEIRPERRERERVEIDIREDIRSDRRERVEIDIRDDEDEADYYRRKTNERAFIGEAYNGATKDWAIVDVPPGTERIQMDGIGGASQEVTWQRYNGVRRSKFNPERERERERIEIRETREEPETRTRERIEIRDDSRRSESNGLEVDISRRTRDHGNHEHENLEIDITTNRRKEDSGRTYEREYERIEEISSDRRVGMPRAPPKERMSDLWTEITKDLVVKEAILEFGYDFEETEYFYYIIQYLRYEDVLELVELSEKIRQERKHHIRQIERERERMERRAYEKEEYERSLRRRERDSGYVDEKIIEREVIYEGRPPRRGW